MGHSLVEAPPDGLLVDDRRGKESRGRRSGDPHAVPNDGSVARKESEDKSRRLRRKHEELAVSGKVGGGGGGAVTAQLMP